jgi:uncharacterized protein (TIGR00255 family)
MKHQQRGMIMMYSMTAFGRNEGHGDFGNAVWEIRSVNHRYSEVIVRLPEGLNVLETAVRDRIRQILQRGKVEVHLRFSPNFALNAQWNINLPLIKQLNDASQTITKQLTGSSFSAISPLEVLRWPGVIQATEMNVAQLEKSVMAVFDGALSNLLSMREREGSALQQLLQQRVEVLEKVIATINQRRPQLIKNQRERLLARFSEAKIALDSERLEHEMVLFAQKIDASEELDRLQTHLQEFRRTLQGGGAVGRRLDFLTQELLRETNTLASKANDSVTSQSAVELKVIIEQLREQVQNIE